MAQARKGDVALREATPLAYLSVIGWPRTILVDRRQILIAPGPYGVYAFDLDAFNLLTPSG